MPIKWYISPLIVQLIAQNHVVDPSVAATKYSHQIVRLWAAIRVKRCRGAIGSQWHSSFCGRWSLFLNMPQTRCPKVVFGCWGKGIDVATLRAELEQCSVTDGCHAIRRR